MKDLKVKDIPDESHWRLKVEAAERMMTLKDFILACTHHVINNQIKLK